MREKSTETKTAARDEDRLTSRDAFRLPRVNYDAVIFDLDGVLTKTAKLHASAWKRMFDRFLASREKDHRPFDIDDDYIEYVDGKGRYDGVRSFLVSRDIELPEGSMEDGADEETVHGLGNRKNRIFHQLLESDGVEVYASALRLLRQLRAKGFDLAVVSSSKNCQRVLEAAELAGFFTTRVDGVDIEERDMDGKPAPDLFVEAAARLDVEPARAVVVEDALSGVAAGRAGGFGLVIGVDRQNGEEELCAHGADSVVRDLSTVRPGMGIDDLPSAIEAFGTIRRRLRNRRPVVCLDYDGTLTPIVARPEDADLSNEMRLTILRLAEECEVAIISGRGLDDVRARVGIDDIVYAGSHGFEIDDGRGMTLEHDAAKRHLGELDAAEAQLRSALDAMEGAQVERKRFSIAVHYRNVAEEVDVERVGAVVAKVLESAPHLTLSHGKKVYDIQPDMDWDKGRALRWVLEQRRLDRPDVVPIYIGDDLTDEDAFAVLGGQGIGIVVADGEKSDAQCDTGAEAEADADAEGDIDIDIDTARDTAAQFSLTDPHAVLEFLTLLAELVERGSGWSMIYRGFDPASERLREALSTLGNGYFCTRGAMPWARADDAHYPGTYIAGGYNRLTTEIAGRAVENEDLVNFPNWLALTFRPAGEDWFDLSGVELMSYRQELNMKEGVLHRELRYRDNEGRVTAVRTRQLVLMEDMHLAALELTIVPENWSGALEVRSALDGTVTNAGVERYEQFDGRHLEPIMASALDERRMILHMRTRQSRLEVAQGARTEVYIDNVAQDVAQDAKRGRDWVAQQFQFSVDAGETVTVEKVVSLYTTRDPAISSCVLEAEKGVARKVRFEELLQRQVLSWRHIWERTAVQLRATDETTVQDIQTVLRLYTFHLLQTASIHSLDIDVGMPSRGWHGEAYRGHIFWDELFIFPILNFRYPQITRSLLLYRYRRLDEAYRAAKEAGYHGAMYPWQSGSNGREESQEVHLNPRSGRWLPDNSNLQRHINAAIVYNIWQYYQVTGDLEFLSFYGAEMILAIARFFASLSSYNETLDRYEIKGVMGPDEYHDRDPDTDEPGLDNNAYTNLMAVFVFERAGELFEILPLQEILELCEKLEIQEEEIRCWDEIARKMRIVFHGDGIISQFEGYDDLEEFDWDGYRERYGDIQRLDRILEAEGDTPNHYQVSKQADVLMLFYLFSADELSEMFERLGYAFTYETIPKNIEYYLERTAHGSSLSRVVHSRVLFRSDRANSWELFTEALQTDVADIQGGTTKEGIHLGAMAGCVDIIQSVYTGLQTMGDILQFEPELPEALESLSMHLRYRGNWLEVDLDDERLRLEALACGALPVTIEVNGDRFQLSEGEVKAVLLQEEEGAVLAGERSVEEGPQIRLPPEVEGGEKE